MKTAIIYCRVSTDKQWQTGDSLDVQEKDCRAYCERMQIDVVGVFREQFTGTSIQRPALEEALGFLKKNKWKIDHFVIHKIDRSTRGGLGDYYEINKKIESYGTILKDAFWIIGDSMQMVHIDNLDTSEYDWAKFNPSEMAVSMLVLQAKHERASILQRTIPQEIRNTRNGYISRQSHFGYQNERICTSEGKLKVIYTHDSTESKWIYTMFEMRASWKFTDHQIVNQINLMGYISRKQKRWNPSRTMVVWEKWWKVCDVKQLQAYIKNPIYAGIIIEKWTNNKPVRWQFQGIVDIDLFNKANRGAVEILEHENGSVSILYGKERAPDKPIMHRARFQQEYPFSRVIKCPHCEWHLTPNKSRSANGNHHYYYQCNGKFGIKHKNYTIRREELNETMQDFLSRMEYNYDVFSLFRRMVEEVWSEKSWEIESEVEDHKRAVLELEEKRETLIKNIDKVMDFPEILKIKNDELREITKKLSIMKDRKIMNEHDKSKEEILSLAKNVFKHLSKAIYEEKNEERITAIFDVILEEPITYENILSNRNPLYPIFSLASKKRAIDDSLTCSNMVSSSWDELCSESNWGQRLWRPLH